MTVTVGRLIVSPRASILLVGARMVIAAPSLVTSYASAAYNTLKPGRVCL